MRTILLAAAVAALLGLAGCSGRSIPVTVVCIQQDIYGYWTTTVQCPDGHRRTMRGRRGEPGDTFKASISLAGDISE